MRKNQLLFVSVLSLCLLTGFFFFGKHIGAAEDVWITINKNSTKTQHRKVKLYIKGIPDAQEMMISNDSGFKGANWEKYAETKDWHLTYGNGVKHVYVKFLNKHGNATKRYSDQIQLDVPASMDVGVKVNNDTSDTQSRYVTLNLSYSTGVELMAISNDEDLYGVEYKPVQDKIQWVLSPGSGEKTVYVEFKDGKGATKIVYDAIKFEEQDQHISEGSLVRSDRTAIYYLGYDGKLHPFLNTATYHSWFDGFADVTTISPTVLQQFQIGTPICVRPASWLLRFSGSDRVYAVEPACQLRPLRSDVEAQVLYGKDWSNRVLDLDFFESNFYTVHGLSVADSANDVIDSDHDGVPWKTEKAQGSSDATQDSDGDTLSDYEEIYYWLSNPNNPDTDGDTYRDGDEVKGGYSPVGTGDLTIRSNTYKYPAGSGYLLELFGIQGPYSLPIDSSYDPYDSKVPNTLLNGKIIRL